jgi:hypothetical protein
MNFSASKSESEWLTGFALRLGAALDAVEVNALSSICDSDIPGAISVCKIELPALGTDDW